MRVHSNQRIIEVAGDASARSLGEHLFSDRPGGVFAVLDGASVPKLPQALWQHKPEHVCLYRGELAPDLAATAPYLVRVEPNTPFIRWVLDEGWGNHWGVFVVAPTDVSFRDLRKHFRTFLQVRDPDGKPMYFRYYDPRVLRVYLPMCNAAESRIVFGPLSSYMMEGEDPAVLLRIEPGRQRPVVVHKDELESVVVG